MGLRAEDQEALFQQFLAARTVESIRKASLSRAFEIHLQTLSLMRGLPIDGCAPECGRQLEGTGDRITKASGFRFIRLAACDRKT